jgi:hypothetical protein
VQQLRCLVDRAQFAAFEADIGSTWMCCSPMWRRVTSTAAGRSSLASCSSSVKRGLPRLLWLSLGQCIQALAFAGSAQASRSIGTKSTSASSRLRS